MKSIGRILLIIFAVLAIVGLVWVALTPNAAGSEIDATEWMSNPLTTYMIIVPVITLIITVVAFVIFKAVDLFKHPSHMKEAMWTAGAIVIAVVLGFIFADNGDIANADNISYAGMQSKLMGTGIIAAGVLLIAGFAFLLYDTIKGIIKS
ncbi:hypothetical protein GO491_02195 [Flavobacteriaceae bacterium Ap0902]|nr:hypothetical protein [Flavobacteriaceae bacterium Ap0902]